MTVTATREMVASVPESLLVNSFGVIVYIAGGITGHMGEREKAMDVRQILYPELILLYLYQ